MRLIGRVLLVDDEEDLRRLIAADLIHRGYQVEQAASKQEAVTLLRAQDFDAVLLDISLGDGGSGIDLCAEAAAYRPDIPFLMITAHGSLDTAVAAIRAGAYDFITKPLSMDMLAIALSRAVSNRQLKSEVRRLRGAVGCGLQLDGMIGESPAIRRVHTLIDRVAESSASVLITGESGTGKELVARALHARSPRDGAPFIAVNCAAMPPALLESELFGHVRGAFTDARRARAGLFVQAEGGTLFLDEIGEMPLEMQSKLLRALQERRVRPVGGDTEVAFDARLISATNRDIDQEVEEGRFRADLYYRINVVHIPVPPLRARKNDVLLLAHHFLQRQAARGGTQALGISTAAARKLIDYDWPGNVRELENCIERAVALAALSEITVEDLPDKIRHHRGAAIVIDASNLEDLVPLAEMERRYVRRVLAAVNGNKSQAARILGLDRRSLYRRLERLDPSAE